MAFADTLLAETDKLVVLGRLRDHAKPAMLKLRQFIAGLDQTTAQGDAA